MATIEQRTTRDGQTVYRVKVRRKGAPLQTATFSKRSEARKWAQMTEGAVLEGRYLKTAEAKRHTLADLIDRYTRDVLPRKKPSTAYNQGLQLQWWRRQLGHCLLAEITPARIVEHRDQLTQEHRSNATANRYLTALSHVLTVAVKEWGWLDDSPMRKVSKLREPRGRVRFLSDQERHRLLDACKKSKNTSLYTIVVLALATGGRQQELLTVRWPDVDFKRGTLTFHQTKNGERRTIPLTGFALDLLKQHARVRHLETDQVFPAYTNIKRCRIRDAWNNAVRRAGIADFHFHDLRHTFASYLAMNGASLLEIAEVLGHKTLAMVKRYAHLTEAHTRGVVERMNRAVFGEP
jgi:integrase